jgi:hypothetical protein
MVVALELRVLLALRFAPDNPVVRVQVSVNVQDRYQAVALTHLVMVELLAAAEIMLALQDEAARVDLAVEQGEGRPVQEYRVVRADLVVALEVQGKLGVHLVAAVRAERPTVNRNRERLDEKRSTTYAHQLLVAQ